MSTHAIALALLALWVMSLALTIADEEQPKPVWSNAHIIKAILAVPILVLFFWLIARSL